MPNWCSNSIAFYQEDGGTALVEAFYADIQKYQHFIEPETGRESDWVGHWFECNKTENSDSLYMRGFFTWCDLCDDYVQIDMESAWRPIPEVWGKMAEKYNLSYVYMAEECGSDIYINTDTSGRFFSTRYMLDCFDVSDLELDSETEEKYGDLLQELGRDTRYYETFQGVIDDFKEFHFQADNIAELNKYFESSTLRFANIQHHLNKFTIGKRWIK